MSLRLRQKQTEQNNGSTNTDIVTETKWQPIISVCVLHFITDVPDKPNCLAQISVPIFGGGQTNESAVVFADVLPIKVPVNYAWPVSDYYSILNMVIDVLYVKTLMFFCVTICRYQLSLSNLRIVEIVNQNAIIV